MKYEKNKCGRFIICLTALILLTTLVCATKINVYPEKSAKTSYQWTTPTMGFPYSTSNYCCSFTPDQSGELRAGNMCYLQPGGYKTRVNQRTTITFKLPVLPKCVKIKNASLYVSVSKVYTAQDLSLYTATSDSWTAVNCNQGTYVSCPGAKAGYDPVNVTYQSKIYVSSTGWKSWNLTAYIAGKYANNQTRTTVTLRGASETRTDCDIYRDWDRNDLILKGPSTSSKPYLVIDYTAC